ncbi:MAG: precorrin-3B C(17)-methyltransferase [Clostridia bacterium]|nr:precorrin-3B C(17)-methyltransferase [Clostridia bacterium]
MSGEKAGKEGRVYVVGLGPGGQAHLTARALEALGESTVVIGYRLYIQFIENLLSGKEVISSGMKQELKRCETALQLARQGQTVSLVSSGDPGIYGMAGPLLELNSAGSDPVEIEVVPGVTAASMSAAVLGAPLMHDAAVISLSDLLTPWEVIEKRLSLTAEGDFVIALYNPRSQGRPLNIARAAEIIGQYRDKKTPVGIVRDAGRPGQEHVLTTLAEMPEQAIDMFSLVIVGNSRTYIRNQQMITPRGYML